MSVFSFIMKKERKSMENAIICSCFLMLFACGGQSNLDIYSSLDSALEDSKKLDRKILLVFDFLGNSTNAAGELLHDKTISERLDGFTVVLLNVDEPGDVGENNRKLQRRKYGSSTQPTFYILDSDGEIIKGPLGYCSKSELIEFIK